MLDTVDTQDAPPETEQLYVRNLTLAEEFGVTDQTIRIWGRHLGLTRWRFPKQRGVWYSIQDANVMRDFVAKPWLYGKPESLETVPA
jgi:hypothetical protein